MGIEEDFQEWLRNKLHNPAIRPRPFPGKYPDFYVTYRDLIAKLETAKMTDITEIVTSPEIAGALGIIQGPVTTTQAGTKIIERKWIYGGIRVPHIHVKEKIFMFDEKQWKDFTDKVRKRLQEKLGAAGAISLEDLQTLDQTVTQLR